MEERQKKHAMWSVASLVLMTLAALEFILLAAVTLWTVAMFRQMFSDLGVRLPQVTRVFVSIPRALYIGIFLALIVALALKEALVQNKPLALGVNAVLMTGGFVYLAVYVAAMFLPLIQIVGAMTN